MERKEEEEKREPKHYRMKAETGGVIPAQLPKFFRLTVSINPQGNLDIAQKTQGFNPYEITGILETVKNAIIQQSQQPQVKRRQ